MNLASKISTFIFIFVVLFQFISVNPVKAANNGTCECNLAGQVAENGNLCFQDENPECYGGAEGVSFCRCIKKNAPTSADAYYSPTANNTSAASNVNNVSCTTKDNNIGVNTALGCVPVQMDKFIAWLLPILFGIGGGIAFLLMIYGFILMTTSNGDPKAVQGAKETITSAIIGLVISIFAIFLLRLIAVDILHIPGIS